MVTVESRLLEVAPGLRLRVLERAGAETPFLLVHGLASNARMWDGVGHALAAAGHPSLAVDLRGHGESDQVEHGFDFETVAGDLATLLDRTGSGPVVAVGQSWGGNVVLELALRHPDHVRGVVCVDGGFISLSRRFPDWETARRQLAPPDFRGMTLESLLARSRDRFDGWPESGRIGALANFRELEDGTVEIRLRRENHMRILREMFEHRPIELASRLMQPVLVIAARNEQGPDKEREVEQFVSALPNGRLAWVDGHHDLHAEQPDVIAGYLLGFLGES
jgi:pimeloyl-ACP methyl ester carboxylesterase